IAAACDIRSVSEVSRPSRSDSPEFQAELEIKNDTVSNLTVSSFFRVAGLLALILSENRVENPAATFTGERVVERRGHYVRRLPD
ncbi:MAG: hypothetical protein QGF00_18665, partial [Planctomycetota bacterium]|nr:hypothetical protein [Planctomycetota bacterium]